MFEHSYDGGAAEETVRFRLDSAEYEIDLNAEHAQQLRDAWRARCWWVGGLAVVPAGLPLREQGIGERAEYY